MKKHYLILFFLLIAFTRSSWGQQRVKEITVSPPSAPAGQSATPARLPEQRLLQRPVQRRSVTPSPQKPAYQPRPVVVPDSVTSNLNASKTDSMVATAGRGSRRAILDSLRSRSDIRGLRFRLPDINFETNSAVLIDSSRSYLDSVIAVIRQFPSIKLNIVGHTDNVGTPGENQLLSENRARTVRNYLVQTGKLPANLITYRGYGEQRPTALNTTPAGRLQNRRVEMVFEGIDITQRNKIYLRNGTIIEAPLVYEDRSTRKIIYKATETSGIIELPCSDVLKILYASGKVQEITCPPVQAAKPQYEVKPVNSSSPSRLSLQLLGTASYMTGGQLWTALTQGYAHTIGFGGTALVEYRLGKNVLLGAQTGYERWSTQVDYKISRSDPPFRQYFSLTSQIPVFVSLRIYAGQRFYIMPEGGIALLSIKAGYDARQETFSGLQTGFGGTLGYTFNRTGKLRFDIGARYRNMTAQKQWNAQFGTPSMQYAGVRLGIGFGL